MSGNGHNNFAPARSLQAASVAVNLTMGGTKDFPLPASATESGSDEGQPLLRSQDELEGALLLPRALPVTSESTDDVVDAAVILPDEQEAPCLPSSSTSLYNPMRDKVHAKQGTNQGRLESELEAEDIQRANRDVYAVNYYNQQEIDRANKLAASLNRKEEGGLIQTSEEALAEARRAGKGADSTTPRSQEFFEGTYGSEYEVSDYDCASYDTKDYDVSEYKSVYEK